MSDEAPDLLHLRRRYAHDDVKAAADPDEPAEQTDAYTMPSDD